MKFLLALSLLVASHAFAGDRVVFDCIVTDMSMGGKVFKQLHIDSDVIPVRDSYQLASRDIVYVTLGNGTLKAKLVSVDGVDLLMSSAMSSSAFLTLIMDHKVSIICVHR